MDNSKKSTLDSRFYYLKRNISLTSPQRVSGLTDSSSLPPVPRYLIWWKRTTQVRNLLLSIPTWLQIFWLPKRGIWIFNHTARIRKGPTGSSSVYLNRLLQVFPNPNIVIDDQKTAVKHQSKSHALQSDIINLLPVAFSKLFPKGDSQESMFWWKMRFWTWIFAWTRPSKVYVLVWYGKEWVIAAAHSKGIPVIELQHGIVYEEHPLYDLREGQKYEGSTFLLPDLFLAYGEHWRQKLIRIGWPEERVLIGGYFLDISAKSDPTPYQPYLLYTSQPGYQQEIIQHIRSIKATVVQRRLNIIIALHPSETSNPYSDILDEQVQTSQLDSYDLLRGCLCHISVCSTLLWEAILFQKPSFMLNSQKHFPTLAQELISLGSVRPLSLGEVPEPFSVSDSKQHDYLFAKLRNAF